jgi:hypothetical protein
MRFILIMSLSFASSIALAAEVYRSIDSAGNVVYSDRPDSANAVPIIIRTAAAAAPAVRQPSPRSAAERAEPDEATVERAVSAQRAEDRAANCEVARTRSASYDTSHRLYRTGADGEREYLTDAQIDEARESARAEIARWCN